MKEIVIIGGPNGAGKTTAARVILADFFRIHEFLNADEIAREIAPDNVESAALAAGRVMIERMRYLVQHGLSFDFETTCAGKSYLRLLGNANRMAGSSACSSSRFPRQTTQHHGWREGSVKAGIRSHLM